MKKFFKIRQVLIFILLIFCGQNANAADIIFPKKTPYTTNSATTYIMGNVKKGAKLTINGENARVWHNGAFCKTVNLSNGENTFILKETNVAAPVVLKITRNTTSKPNLSKKTLPAETVYNNLMYAQVLTDGAPVRTNSSTSADRITHLPKDTIVLIDTNRGDWYKINIGKGTEQLWIHKRNIKLLYPVNNRIKISIRDAEFSNNKTHSLLKIKLDLPIAYKIQEKGNNIFLTLYGVKDYTALCNAIKKQEIFPKLKITEDKDNNITILIPSESQIWGYEANYEGNILIFKKRKNPQINPNCPLENLTIAIDAGHGGKESGTIGPTRIPEKDVNLAIAKMLKKELLNRGACVIMTREEDKYIDLYERPEIANKNNAIILLSIHSNSMVDGDPFQKHGTSVFYYNEHAKILADTIKLKMLEKLKLKDDGTRYASFVLTRPTIPVSVLIEVAYMPNPDEYLKLINKHFQYKTARSIAEGLEEYLKNNIFNTNQP